MVDETEPMIWRGPMVHGALTQMTRDVAWGELDILVVDLPPGTGDAQLSICQLLQLDGIVIVSTPQDLALLDVRRGIAMFNKVRGAHFGHHREYEHLHLPALRQAKRHFQSWRRRRRSAQTETCRSLAPCLWI